MARLQLSGGARQFYEKVLNESDDEATATNGSNASLKQQSTRRKERVRQKSAVVSPGRGGRAQLARVSAPEASQRASEGPDEAGGSQGDASDASESVSNTSDSGSGGTSSSSGDGTDIASDLEGLPVASALGNMELSGKQQKKKAKSTSQAITEAGLASKLGVAFSRVLERTSKQGIMQGSKSVQKRRREEETETAQNKLAKQERRERRKRGHEPVPIKGRDPAHDTREKTLISIATKGVVQLFNAISKAQAAKRQADAAGVKRKDVVKTTKAALLGALQPEAKASEGTPGWKVLQQGFTGMHEAGKLKDLDRDNSSDGEIDADEVDDQEDSDGIDQW